MELFLEDNAYHVIPCNIAIELVDSLYICCDLKLTTPGNCWEIVGKLIFYI